MIVLTGAAGFIGSALVAKLNNKGIKDIILVDDFNSEIKNRNLVYKSFIEKIDRNIFFEWLDKNHSNIDFIYHLGARTDTTEFDFNILNKLNLNYSIEMWEKCIKYSIPLVYASSAATYGDGSLGYNDSHKIIGELKPLNPYGISKNEFDKFVIKQTETPPYWVGLKFFNVYGPNEYHKNRMASVVFHAFNQIQSTDKLKLFRSHHSDFEDGKQLRDFIYVKDVVSVCNFLMHHRVESGIYNLGTGKARTFFELGESVFNSLRKKIQIEFVDIPQDIRDKYQYFTQAEMQKLHSQGYNKTFYTLEEGINDYVNTYLFCNEFY